MRIIIKTLPMAAASVLLLTSCASAGTPSETTSANTTGVSSCGLELSFDAAPKRAITLEQGATEMMLVLGLEDRMIGTSYLTDSVGGEYKAAYESVPVLADLYPTTEQVRSENPDFVYSMRSSAFSPDAAGARDELVDLGVPAYLSSNDCEDPTLIDTEIGFDQIFGEITDLATIFDVADRGEELVNEQKAIVDDVTVAAADTTETTDTSVVWIYSTVNGAPIVAGHNGLAQVMGDTAGTTNAFADLDAQWGEVSWDDIAQRDPDVIVVAHLTRGLDGDSADDKIAFLQSDPVTSNMAAVADNRIIALPATALDPSVRSVDALKAFADGIASFNTGAASSTDSTDDSTNGSTNGNTTSTTTTEGTHK